MARPKQNSGEPPAELRLEEAFWTLIERFPLKEITINMIVVEAKCTRGSFYYHFADINALIDSIIERNFPAEIPHKILSFVMSGESDIYVMTDDPVFTKKVDRLCLLAGSHSSIEVIERVKKAMRGVWIDTLQLDEEKLPQEAWILFEFLVNGAVGILAYRSRPEVDLDVASCFQVVMPEVPQAFIKRFMTIVQKTDRVQTPK